MISPKDIAVQIKKYTQIFKFVGFIADFHRILDQISTVPLSLPACFVCFRESTTTENEALNGYCSVEEIEVSVFVVLDNSEDTSGATGMSIDWTSCTSDLKKCLMNWVPNEQATKPISYDGCQYVTMTGSREIYECKFEVDQQLTEEDGFIPTYDELQEVDIDSKYFKDSELEYEIETVSSSSN